MHQAGLIVAVLAVLAIALWVFIAPLRPRGAPVDAKRRDAGSELPLAGLGRRLSLRSTATIDDPLVAATALLVEVARLKSELAAAQEEAIITEILEHFRLGQTEARDTLHRAVRLCRTLRKGHHRLSALLRPIDAHFSLEEKRRVASMMLSISNVDGPQTEAQAILISSFLTSLR